MFLENVILDKPLSEDLINLALAENFIKAEPNADILFIGKEAPYKEQLLRLLTLYDNIDFSIAEDEYDWSFFIDEGLMKKDSLLLNSKPGKLEEALCDKNDMNIKMIKKNAIQMLLLNKELIIYSYIQENPNVRNNSKDKLNVEDLNKNYNQLISYLEKGKRSIVETPLYYMLPFYLNLVVLYDDMVSGLFYSRSKNSNYCNVYNQYIDVQQTNAFEIIDNLYYLVQTKLTDEVLILPSPETITEALEIRNNIHMKRFREVISEWCIKINEGNAIAEAKIRKDIASANKELNQLNKIVHFKNSPLNFWINSIGGHIPYLSNVITVLNTLEGAYEHIQGKNSNWILLNQRKDSTLNNNI